MRPSSGLRRRPGEPGPVSGHPRLRTSVIKYAPGSLARGRRTHCIDHRSRRWIMSSLVIGAPGTRRGPAAVGGGGRPGGRVGARVATPLRLVGGMIAAVVLAVCWPLLAMLPLAAVGLFLGLFEVLVGGAF